MSMLEDEKTLHEVALINPDYVVVILGCNEIVEALDDQIYIEEHKRG